MPRPASAAVAADERGQRRERHRRAGRARQVERRFQHECGTVAVGSTESIGEIREGQRVDRVGERGERLRRRRELEAGGIELERGHAACIAAPRAWTPSGRAS
jgi:hypothetical protein